jgi:hypothetical protein
VGVKLGIGSVTAIFNRPRREMVEGCANHVGTGDSFFVAVVIAVRHRVLFNFKQAPSHRPFMRLDQAVVAADQSLEADGLRRAKSAVPAGRVAPVLRRGGHQYRAAMRVNALQQRGEVGAADIWSYPASVDGEGLR